MIKQAMPLIAKEDFGYVREIIKTGQVARGEFVESLQNEMTRRFRLRYSLATSSGTAALHLALLALGIKETDEVIIPSYACSALLNAVNYSGAIPVLADIDPETFNLTPETIKPKLAKKTKAIIVTHTFGFPADLERIIKPGIPVIEDCAHAIGSLYKGRPTGSRGRIAVFSMYATKMLCSGEGGMLCTNDFDLAERIRDLNDPDMRDDYKVRFNYKMSDLTAGFALSQLRKIESFVSRRSLIAARYEKAFMRLPVNFQKVLPGTTPSFYRFVICTSRSKDLIRSMQKRGILCDRPVYKPLHRYIRSKGNFPGSDIVWAKAVSIPLYPALKDKQVSEIIKAVKDSFKYSENS
ncbi:MAG: DegT/DnrJ/EryC1/StrS family aminotransferase [Candidatus Omnitrophica bacterium]|nr:DegT/DnrJ/EryC1/StrS family aminotransferase [Candidatus Omnitrophota bacterium]